LSRSTRPDSRVLLPPPSPPPHPRRAAPRARARAGHPARGGQAVPPAVLGQQSLRRALRRLQPSTETKAGGVR
jgi:hypothetical protein